MSENAEKARYTVVIDEQLQRKLADIAKTYKISQGAVIEVLVEQADVTALHDAMSAKREEKVAGRQSRTAKHKDLIEMLGKMTPEQIEQLRQRVSQ